MLLPLIKKTPLQIFSKSLVGLKHLQLIQHDMEKLDVRKKNLKIYFLNQSYIIHLVALWQVFNEQQAEYCITQMKHINSPGVFEPLLDEMLIAAKKEFKTPNRVSIDRLFNKVILIEKVSSRWSWDGMDKDAAIRILHEVIDVRHQIAHETGAKVALSIETNFDYMRHLYNLAYMIDYETSKKIAELAGEEFSRLIKVPHPKQSAVSGNLD